MVRTQQAIDRRPGRLPDIRTDDGGITFVMVPHGAPHRDELVIRCDDNDEAWVSIRPRRTGGTGPYPYAALGGYPAGPTYGGIRIDLPQKDAQVYTDGYLAGRVNDFNGSTERLLLTGGSHRIEIRAEGFAPLTVDVDIAPGRTIMYRADLRQPPSPPQ